MDPAAVPGAPILFVEDDAAVRELVADRLRLDGFEVREAASGEEALGLIETEAIGLVLLDMVLPGMSGADVVRTLRSRVETETLPIMILTGQSETFSLVESLDLGADAFLTKPIDLEELTARVRARLRSEEVSVRQAKRDRETFYRTLVEQSADGILVSDASGRYVEANQAICRMLGYSREELLAGYTPNLSAVDDPVTPEDLDQRLAETAAEAGLLVERRYRRKDGTSLPAEVSLSQLSDGRLQRTIRDITARLAAEAERARLASAVEQSSDSILIADLAGAIEYVNPAFERISGYSRAEVIGQNPRMLSSGLQPADFYRVMWDRLLSGDVWSGLLVNRHKDGSLVQLEASISPMFDPDDAVTGYVGVQRDVTENVATQVALQNSERNLAEAQRIAHIGSWERNLATGTITWSDESYRLMGLEPGTFDGSLDTYGLMVHPDDQDRAMPSADMMVQHGPTEREYRVIHADGSTRVVRERSEVIRDAAGTPVRYVGTTQDITEQVAAEAERSRLIMAIENTADAIWMHDLDKNVTYVNPSFSRLYGYARDEIIGQHAGIVDSGRHAPEFFNQTFAEVAAGEIWTGTIVNRCKDGALIEVEAAISPAVDGQGKLIGWVQSDRDVTREHQLESEVQRAARERQTIEVALGRIDPSASPEEIAAIACTAILELGGTDSAWVTELGPDRGLVLGSAGQAASALAPREQLPPERVRYLMERASVGPWVEALKVDPSLDNAFGERLAMTGLHTAAYAPIKGAGGVIGVLGFGVHDTAAIEQLNEHVPALATFAWILGALLASGLETRRRSQVARESIQTILDTAAFTPFFQPIVDLNDGTVVGYEALSRFADGTRPDVAFGLAERAGLELELELATLAAALEASSVLPAGAYLSLNASPSLIASGALREMLEPLKRSIVLEVTEHSVVQDYEELRAAGKGLGQNVRFAVDDAGAGYASFRHILELEPAVVKLDIGLIRGIDVDRARQALLAGMSYFAVKRKIKLVAEGIETTAELAALGQLGIRYGQGYLLGRPQDGRGPGPWPTHIRWSDPGAGKG